MRTIALATILVGLTAFLGYFWVVADRQFDSYAGVESGMSLAEASGTLRKNGWIGLPSKRSSARQGALRRHLCGDGRATQWTEGKSPDYTLVLHTNEDCEITKILRRTRKLEL